MEMVAAQGVGASAVSAVPVKKVEYFTKDFTKVGKHN